MAPQIPLYGDNRVQETDLKRTPLSTETPSIGAFGGGERLAQGAGMVEKIILDAKKEADEVAVQDFDNNLAMINKELSAKALSRKGKDAFNLPDEISKEYDEKISKLEKNLSGATQRSVAKQRAFERKQQLLSAAEKHSSAEIGAYKASVYETGIRIDQEEALLNSHDPAFVDAAIKRQHEKLDKLAEQSAEIQGKLPLLKFEAQSKTYSSILEKKINAFNEIGGVEETKAYFDKVKGLMTSDDKLKSEEALEKATLDYKGLANSDKLFEKYKYSPTKVQEELMKIKDPKERKVTRDYFNQAMGDFKAFENAQQDQTMRSVYNKIKESKGDLKTLRPMIKSLDARDQEWFEKIAEETRNGTTKGYDKQFYYSLMEQIRTPEGLNKFKGEVLSKPEFVARLGSKWEEVVKLQQKQFDDDELKGMRSVTDMIDQAYQKAGYDKPTSKDSKKVWADYDMYREAIEDQIRRTKDDSPENIQKITNGLLKERRLSNKAAWGPISGRIIDFFSSEDPAFKIKAESVDLDEIDSTVRAELETSLRDQGYSVTEENLKALYVEALKNDRI